jgi:hypothetical protein
MQQASNNVGALSELTIQSFVNLLVAVRQIKINRT